MAVLIGGYGAIAGFGFRSGDSIRELSPYLLAAGELFLFTTAVLISIRCFFDRRIVHAAETATARREPLQFSLQQLLGLSAVWALPLGAPGLFSGSPSAAGESILSCSIVFPPVMLVAAPLGQAALTRHRPGRKLLFAAFALGALSLFESIAFVALAWRGMPTVVSRLTLVLWGIGSVAAFNGAIAAMVLPTLLVVRRAGYCFSQWRLTPALRPEPARQVFHIGVQ
jgi:hypothetical protein